MMNCLRDRKIAVYSNQRYANLEQFITNKLAFVRDDF
nr:MAG TPA: hypothetical protein [Caudoviricetes sp.]